MSLLTQIAISLNAQVSVNGDLGMLTQAVRAGANATLQDGSGAGQANKIFSDTRTLAASASESLDLAGVLTDAFGAAITFAKVKAIIVAAKAANTNDVVVGGAASNAFATPFGAATDKVKVKPGGAFALFDPGANGYAVTATTADLLQIANGNSGTPVTYDIVIVGA